MKWSGSIETIIEELSLLISLLPLPLGIYHAESDLIYAVNNVFEKSFEGWDNHASPLSLSNTFNLNQKQKDRLSQEIRTSEPFQLEIYYKVSEQEVQSALVTFSPLCEEWPLYLLQLHRETNDALETSPNLAQQGKQLGLVGEKFEKLTHAISTENEKILKDLTKSEDLDQNRLAKFAQQLDGNVGSATKVLNEFRQISKQLTGEAEEP